ERALRAGPVNGATNRPARLTTRDDRLVLQSTIHQNKGGNDENAKLMEQSGSHAGPVQVLPARDGGRVPQFRSEPSRAERRGGGASDPPAINVAETDGALEVT